MLSDLSAAAAALQRRPGAADDDARLRWSGAVNGWASSPQLSAALSPRAVIAPQVLYSSVQYSTVLYYCTVLRLISWPRAVGVRRGEMRAGELSSTVQRSFEKCRRF